MTDQQPDTGAKMPAHQRGWQAVAALLDRETTDGRCLDASGAWTLRPGAPLWVPAAAGAATPNLVVGEVRALVQAGPQMHAYGTVHHRPTAQAMASGRLLPEIGLGPHQSVDLASDSWEPVFRFTGGEIAYVRAGTSPVWPDLGFTVYDTWEQAAQALHGHLAAHPDHTLLYPGGAGTAAAKLAHAGTALGEGASVLANVAGALTIADAQRILQDTYTTVQSLHQLIENLRVLLLHMDTAQLQAPDDPTSVHRLLCLNVVDAEVRLLDARNALDVARNYAAVLYTL